MLRALYFQVIASLHENIEVIILCVILVTSFIPIPLTFFWVSLFLSLSSMCNHDVWCGACFPLPVSKRCNGWLGRLIHSNASESIYSTLVFDLFILSSSSTLIDPLIGRWIIWRNEVNIWYKQPNKNYIMKDKVNGETSFFLDCRQANALYLSDVSEQ